MHNLIDGYKVLLASNFTLYAKTHAAHFNITGMFFQSLHKLFKDQYEDLWDAHDAIGENMRKLDAFALSGLMEYAKYSVVPDSNEIMDARGYVDRLLLDHERMIVLVNRVFKLAEAENRQDHMNFLAERLDSHSKHRWMLKATAQSISAPQQSVDVAIRL